MNHYKDVDGEAARAFFLEQLLVAAGDEESLSADDVVDPDA
ncbi:hypothetical protein QT231_21365 [Halomonas sp. SpR1]|nr:hypothetical protein [Halomonas sp. SpR1]MDQ7735257.1 hypothetical protein [Halomonas sp. SpR1]